MPTKKKTAKPLPVAKAKPAAPELDLINSLAGILNATGLSEIELEQKGVRVRVSRGVVAHVQAAAPAAVAAAAAPAMAPPPPAPAREAADTAGAVKSPMVGTCYMASAPGSPPFVEVGATVKQGQTLLIIEAMKTMNQIPAPRSGKVVEIRVENGQPVEFGEVLMVIE